MCHRREHEFFAAGFKHDGVGGVNVKQVAELLLLHHHLSLWAYVCTRHAGITSSAL